MVTMHALIVAAARVLMHAVGGAHNDGYEARGRGERAELTV